MEAVLKEPELTMRSRVEAKAYVEKQYPWLSFSITADALVKLAHDILFVKPVYIKQETREVIRTVDFKPGWIDEEVTIRTLPKSVLKELP